MLHSGPLKARHMCVLPSGVRSGLCSPPSLCFFSPFGTPLHRFWSLQPPHSPPFFRPLLFSFSLSYVMSDPTGLASTHCSPICWPGLLIGQSLEASLAITAIRSLISTPFAGTLLYLSKDVRSNLKPPEAPSSGVSSPHGEDAVPRGWDQAPQVFGDSSSRE